MSNSALLKHIKENQDGMSGLNYVNTMDFFFEVTKG